MKISRRTVLAASASAPFLVPGRASAASATIQIHSGRHRGEIDKKIFGNFIEHLGRCITGGIFDEGSPLSDKEGFRKDVMSAVQEMGVPFLRWPGGNFSSNYNWRDGIGPRDKRPPRLEMAWGTVESNRFGTHEFLDYAAQIGTAPYICCNLGTGSWVTFSLRAASITSRRNPLPSESGDFSSKIPPSMHRPRCSMKFP